MEIHKLLHRSRIVSFTEIEKVELTKKYKLVLYKDGKKLVIVDLLAVVFLLIARSGKRKARECTVPVTAEIIEIQKRWVDLDADGPRSYSWFPKYRFRWNGRDMEIFDNTGHKEGYQQVGDRRTQLYSVRETENWL